MNLLLRSYGRLTIWIIGFLAISWLIGHINSDDIVGWYKGLEKPDITPPNLVFPLVWTTLYIMLAVAGYFLARKRDSQIGQLCFALFWVQMLMNWMWSVIFFEWHLLGFSFGWILFLILLVAVLILKAWDHDRKAALLMLPYLLWLAFASYLNGTIWLLN